MSLLPGGKLRSYHNGQVIFAKDWENEFKNLQRAYNVGQAFWFGINFFPGAPDVCAQGDLTHLFPPDNSNLDSSFLYKIEGMYVSYGLAGTSCDVYTMKVNGVAVADLLVPAGVPPDDRTISVSNEISSVKVCAGQCCTTYVVDTGVTTDYIWNTPLDPGDVPQIGDEVTFTVGGAFDTASCPGCSSLFAVYVNGVPSGLSVCIPSNANVGDIFSSNKEIVLNPDDKVTIVPEKVGPHQDITTQIFGCRAPSLINLVLEPILTKFYFDAPFDPIAGTYDLLLTPPTSPGVLGRAVISLVAGTDKQFLGKIYRFPSDCFINGSPDNTFQTTVKIQLAGYTTIGNTAIGSHAVKVKLQLVSGDEVSDLYNPSPSNIKLTLISSASSLFTNAMGTAHAAPPTNYTANVSVVTGGNVLEATAVAAGDYLVLSMFITLAANSDINSFTGDVTTHGNGDTVQYIDAGDVTVGPWSESYIALGMSLL